MNLIESLIQFHFNQVFDKWHGSNDLSHTCLTLGEKPNTHQVGVDILLHEDMTLGQASEEVYSKLEQLSEDVSNLRPTVFYSLRSPPDTVHCFQIKQPINARSIQAHPAHNQPLVCRVDLLLQLGASV